MEMARGAGVRVKSNSNGLGSWMDNNIGTTVKAVCYLHGGLVYRKEEALVM